MHSTSITTLFGPEYFGTFYLALALALSLSLALDPMMTSCAVCISHLTLAYIIRQLNTYSYHGYFSFFSRYTVFDIKLLSELCFK